MLQLNHVSKEYETKKILEDLTMSIEDGEIIALKGKNGIGKTTLLNIIGGLISYEGNVIYNGVDAKEDFHRYISSVSFLSNESFSYQYLTLMEMIDFLDHILKKSGVQTCNDRIMQLIELLDLSEYKDILIKNLSLGTKQKVSIVVNMYANPKIILLDEPFVNLDEQSVKNLLFYLKAYIDRNQAIMIYSTHSKDVSLDAFCSKILLITDSRTIQLRKN